jgi:uncharacterized protein YjiS (DUF1127 family)
MCRELAQSPECKLEKPNSLSRLVKKLSTVAALEAIAAWLSKLSAQRRVGRTRRELEALSGRQLRDIGLERSDIDSAAQRALRMGSDVRTEMLGYPSYTDRRRRTSRW